MWVGGGNQLLRLSLAVSCLPDSGVSPPLHHISDYRKTIHIGEKIRTVTHSGPQELRDILLSIYPSVLIPFSPPCALCPAGYHSYNPNSCR
ncbi:hypothetical protein RRG08_021811 [Elysia crispata]|uniref:Secreted protein n=1 Tax=Elysia crispata TaxID=231223 RepID=A0AAE0ZZC2_9GAST|nr:hypothetical protein RRG08_021811 [Elysia crispata]